MKNHSIERPKTILYVDDEDLILDVGKAMLEGMGYNVIIANSGKMAIDIVSKCGDAIDLIILDITMPDIDGDIVFHNIHGHYPNIPVLLSSGYSHEGVVAELLQKGCHGFIAKPFNIDKLSQKLDLIFSMDVGLEQGACISK